jgi:hypothetical protein
MDDRYKVTQLELEGIGAQLEIEEDAVVNALSAHDIRVMAEGVKAALKLESIEFDKAIRWLEVYQNLLNNGWRWRVAAYVAWASTPKRKRWPRTQDDLAINVLGLTSDRAIITWRKKNPAIDELIGILQGNAMLEGRADAIDALLESAATESYRNQPDRRLLFQLTGDLVEKSSIETRDGSKLKQNLRELSDAELLTMGGEKAKELLKRMRDEILVEEPVEKDLSEGSDGH